MSSKSFSGPIHADKSVTVIHGGSVPKKNEIGGGPQKKPDMAYAIHAAKIDNEEVGLTKITKEFSEALINGRKKLSTEEKSFTQKDLAQKGGVPIDIIQRYEKVGSVVDAQFQANCTKIKKALGLSVLPKIVPPKLGSMDK